MENNIFLLSGKKQKQMRLINFAFIAVTQCI